MITDGTSLSDDAQDEEGKSVVCRDGKSVVSANGQASILRQSDDLVYEPFESEERHMAHIQRLIGRDLSEPYSIYTYRYFIHNWPQLCFLCRTASGEYVGAIVCKLSDDGSPLIDGDYEHTVDETESGGMERQTRQGYIAMLAVDVKFRRRSIASSLVQKAIDVMMREDVDEIILETEITNKSALNLYERFGFVRDKRLFSFYLNGVDGVRLKLWLK